MSVVTVKTSSGTSDLKAEMRLSKLRNGTSILKTDENVQKLAKLVRSNIEEVDISYGSMQSILSSKKN